MNRFVTLSGLALICSTALSSSDSCEVYTTPTFDHSPSVTIVEPCPETLYPTPANSDVKPSVSERVVGKWQGEVTYHPGCKWLDEFGRTNIRTATIIHKPKTDFLQLDSNGKFVEHCQGEVHTGFYGLDYSPKQNSQGKIGFYNRTLELIKTGKIEVSDTHLRITNKDNWSHVYNKPQPTPAPRLEPTLAPRLEPIPQR